MFCQGVSKPLPTAVLARREPVDHINFGKALATPAVRRIAMENKGCFAIDHPGLAGRSVQGGRQIDVQNTINVHAGVTIYKNMTVTVDLKKVKGSGKDGRVLKEDVLRFLGHVEAGYLSGPIGVKALSAGSNQAGEKVLSLLAEDRIVPLRGYTRVMIKTMTEALKIPHFGYNDELCIY
ncbi:e3 binding domain protein [Dictyocaulus viviparus]|uniref:E3 binding domain protein n=1 Tax=Dictyocaulus viviparus TaxID=29172 RepID=A0A0D8XC28_DICVI|nr:e3 binding domain protein [Dictyocaulus viviparus]